MQVDVSPLITVFPSGIAFHAVQGESVYRAAWRAGYYWPNSCNAAGSCLDCRMHVTETENLTPADPREIRLLKYVCDEKDLGHTRLACQAGVTGDVQVTKDGVRPVKEIFPDW